MRRRSDGEATYRAGSRAVAITHPGRVLFPDDGFTKRDLADYHHAVAPAMLRHLAGRPLMLQRFPAGIGSEGFYQKEGARGGVPGWIRTVEVTKEGGTVRHPVVDDEAGLLALTNLSTVTFHRWPSRADRPDAPDLLVVDLDPSSDDFAPVRRTARWVRSALNELDLPAFPAVTGSRGVHVVTPLDRSAPSGAVAAFAAGLASLVAARHPRDVTVEGRKSRRRGRLYVDVARNGWAQTAVAPYSVRARRGAPVAMPIWWEELDQRSLRPDGWTMATAPRRLDEVGDPWAGIGRHRRSLATRAARLDTLLSEAGARP